MAEQPQVLDATAVEEDEVYTSKFCPECGARLPEGAKRCEFCNTVQEDNITTFGEKAAVSDFLFNWKTNVPFSILGLVVNWGLLLGTRFLGGTVSTTLSIVIYGAIIYYCLIIYPTYFGNRPKFTSNELVSFLNCACGSLVFGLLWNHNLTIKKFGISYMVLTALACLNLASIAMVSFGILR